MRVAGLRERICACAKSSVTSFRAWPWRSSWALVFASAPVVLRVGSALAEAPGPVAAEPAEMMTSWTPAGRISAPSFRGCLTLAREGTLRRRAAPRPRPVPVAATVPSTSTAARNATTATRPRGTAARQLAGSRPTGFAPTWARLAFQPWCAATVASQATRSVTIATPRTATGARPIVQPSRWVGCAPPPASAVSPSAVMACSWARRNVTTATPPPGTAAARPASSNPATPVPLQVRPATRQSVATARLRETSRATTET